MSGKIDKTIDLERLFYPRAIGIIGASHNPTGGGYFVQCMEGKFKGKMYLFNPRLKGQKLNGYPVYGSILEIPDDEIIDYVILGVPAQLCPQLLEEVGQKKVPFVTIFASGFSEIGREDLEKEVLSIARKYNIRIIGPNCLGVYNPSVGLYFGRNQSKKAGNFSGIFQSGGLAVNAAQLAVAHGCYVSKLLSIGNAIDLSYPDFLEYFLHDDKTAIIGLYLENLKSRESGRRFFEAAKNCNLNRKPVILWKVGFGERTRKAILSHTGGLAGDARIWKAVAKQTGCCLVENSSELAALASAFKLVRLPASRNIALIGIGGGSTIEAGDILERYNINIPQLTDKTIKKMSRFLKDVNTNLTNPIDLGAQGAFPNIYYRTIITLAKDPNIDAIVFVKDPERFGKLEEIVIGKLGFKKGMNLNRAFIRYIGKAKRISKKPLICIMLKINEGFEEYKSRYNFKLKLLNRNVPVFENFELAGKILNHLNTYREFLQKYDKYPKNNKSSPSS
ncbi:MAG: CoA-binding protein [Promethearchaeota archaeon]